MRNKITFYIFLMICIIISSNKFLAQDGQLDATFGLGGIVMNAFNVIGSGSISASAIQNDGKIITAGWYYDGTQFYFALSRYVGDNLDNTFCTNGIVYTAVGTSSDFANTIAIQSDGKIIAGGISRIGGNYDFALVRYNQDGSIDSTFGSDGIVTTAIGGTDNLYSVAIQNDGKIIAAGTASFATIDFAIVRYNPDGSLDNTFGTNGIKITQIGPSSDVIQSVLLQGDGKIVAVGYAIMDIAIGQMDFVVARYNQDGSLDNTFGTSGYVITQVGNSYDMAYSALIQSDGKIVVAGQYVSSTSYDFALTRYNTNGSLDNSFGTNGIVTTQTGPYDDQINSIKIQNDGKIVAAGLIDNGTYEDFAVARYNTNGTLDNTFGNNGIVITSVGTGDDNSTSAIIESDGKIIVSGFSTIGTDDRCALVRYNTNGSLDNSYGMNGILLIQYGKTRNAVYSIKLQPDGKIIAGGESFNGSNFDFALARYNTNGELDNTFGNGGLVITDIGMDTERINSLAIQSDGKIIAAGYTHTNTYFEFALARYNQDGTLDNTFGTNGIVTTQIGIDNDQINSIVLQGDGKIVAGGKYYNGNNDDFALVRYNQDGSLDNTFGINGIVTTQIGTASEEIKSVAIQSDGKIIAGGYSEDGTNNFTLARYNSNGSLDNNFGTSGITTNTQIGEAKTILLQTDGKIIGTCYSYNGSNSDFAVVRYNSNGTIDNAFGTNGIAITQIGLLNDFSYSASLQNDGKIVTAGYYEKVNDFDFAVIRYNTNGTLDITFGTNGIVTTSIGIANNHALVMTIQSDMKIIAAGYSYYDNDNSVFTLARYIGDASSGLEDDTQGEIPSMFLLGQNYPNPFNPGTTIQFSIPEQSFVKLEVFNSLGEKISTLVSEELKTGNYKYEWNAEKLSSGIYFYRLSTNNFSKMKKMILLK